MPRRSARGVLEESPGIRPMLLGIGTSSLGIRTMSLGIGT
jgi:hypothetical protein